MNLAGSRSHTTPPVCLAADGSGLNHKALRQRTVLNYPNSTDFGQMDKLPANAVLLHRGETEGAIPPSSLKSGFPCPLAVTVPLQPPVECFVHSLYAVLEDLRMDCSVLRKQGFHLHQIPFLGVEIGIVF